MGYLYFNIQITSGGSTTGPYNVYYDDTSHPASWYPDLGLATGVTYSQLYVGIPVSVPDSATSLLVVNTDTNCTSPGNTKTYTIINNNLILQEDGDVLLDESGNNLQQE